MALYIAELTQGIGLVVWLVCIVIHDLSLKRPLPAV